ncbi:hypothetical protein RB653_002542 [Dictyostelium firmibasis]|uniref:NADH:ubiquinone oxidoreductase intermediate-associated protein 30 domain-containing protein n=1 Tax=Dictyostelium firmibasis TaxID=79012 RepID=A0AAN7TQQ1_9MYCE
MSFLSKLSKMFNPFAIVEHKEIVLYSFRQPQKLDKWRIVTDQEVGGFTTASFKFNPSDQFAEFSGILSKKLPENNERIKSSGYAGVFGKVELSDYDLEKFNRFSIRVKSDKRTYSIALLKSGEKQTMYKSLFAATPDQWETIEVPLSEFFKVHKGIVEMDLQKMNPQGIDSIGFVQTDKDEGEFNLKVEYVKLVQSQSKANSLDSRMVSSSGRVIHPPNS